jgi:protein phosphatase
MTKDTLHLPWCHAEAITDIGKVRHNNEDRYLLQPWPDGEAILAVVTDGIGGNSSGEIAAQMAVDTFKELLDQPLPLDAKEQYETLVKQCYLADERIREKAVTSFDTLGMGTTIVAALITPTNCVHIHAGDSRLYHFHKGEIKYQTLDHSIIQLLLETGRVKPEDIPKHPMRSVLNSCLGGKNAQGDFSIDPKWQEDDSPVIVLENEDYLLLCSDGLNNSISDTMLENLFKEMDIERLNTELIKSALEHGGSDNITCLTIKILTIPLS